MWSVGPPGIELGVVQHQQLAFINFSAGFAKDYGKLVFKIIVIPSTDVYVKFAGGSPAPETEKVFALGTYAEDVAGTTGWKQK